MRFMSVQLKEFAFLAFVFLCCECRVSAEELPLVWVVSTGGTIAEKIDPSTGAAVPAVSGGDLMRAVPGLARIARIKVFPLCNIDSSHMTPDIWRKLALKVNELLAEPEVKGVVVTHGTDTMAEGAFFLELTVTSDKPVVFVGAMRNASELSPDGPPHLAEDHRSTSPIFSMNGGR